MVVRKTKNNIVTITGSEKPDKLVISDINQDTIWLEAEVDGAMVAMEIPTANYLNGTTEILNILNK